MQSSGQTCFWILWIWGLGGGRWCFFRYVDGRALLLQIFWQNAAALREAWLCAFAPVVLSWGGGKGSFTPPGRQSGLGDSG
jgi:hypothetical protein